MRYYQNTYPDLNDLVIVQVKTVSDIGAYVSLLEYDGIEGMIPLSELTNRRFKSYHKLTKIGKIEICSVIAVDKEKGCIDLSKKSVSTEDLVKCEQKWNKSKFIQSMLSHISDMCSMSLLDVHTLITWPLYEKYGHAYDAFRLYLSNPSSVPEMKKLSETHNLLYKLITDNINKRMKCQLFKIRSEIDLQCFNQNGIQAIKDSLSHALKEFISSKISIKLISSPTFLITTETSDKDDGISLLYKVIDCIRKKINEYGGSLYIKSEPHFEDKERKEDEEKKEEDNEDNEDIEDIEDKEDIQ